MVDPNLLAMEILVDQAVAVDNKDLVVLETLLLYVHLKDNLVETLQVVQVQVAEELLVLDQTHRVQAVQLVEQVHQLQ